MKRMASWGGHGGNIGAEKLKTGRKGTCNLHSIQESHMSQNAASASSNDKQTTSPILTGGSGKSVSQRGQGKNGGPFKRRSPVPSVSIGPGLLLRQD